MVGEFTLNENKAYKHIVKHKRRVNHVFSELGAETTIRPRLPGPDKKTPTLGAPSSSAVVAPSKPQSKRVSRKEKSKEDAGIASSPALGSSKTKSLESSRKKRKVSKGTSEAKIQDTISNLPYRGCFCFLI
jgi:hypothetical protein